MKRLSFQRKKRLKYKVKKNKKYNADVRVIYPQRNKLVLFNLKSNIVVDNMMTCNLESFQKNKRQLT